MRDLMVVTGVWLQAAEPVVGGAQANWRLLMGVGKMIALTLGLTLGLMADAAA
mgnify:CR=1 FL=1